MMPLVSVVIPAHNRAGMITEAIESVLSQKYPAFELLIIDDGSTDNTREIIDKYELKYIYQQQLGVSAARNLGTRNSTGKYICFLDSDDLWLPAKLSIQAGFMEANPQIPLCYTDEIWIRKGVRVNPHKKHQKYSGHIFKYCLDLCIISPSSAMIRRDFLIETGGFDEALPACEDYDLWLRICKDYPVEFISKALIVKRGGHSDQLSHKYWGNDRFRVQSLLKLLQSGELNEEYMPLAKNTLVEKCRILAQGSFKRGKTTEGEYYLSILNFFSCS